MAGAWGADKLVGQGVDLEAAVVPYTQEELHPATRATIVTLLGAGEGYTGYESAISALSSYVSLQAQGLNAIRWLVVESGGRTYLYEGRITEVDYDPDEPLPDPPPRPCRINPDDGELASWWAFEYVVPITGEAGYIQYGGGPRGTGWCRVSGLDTAYASIPLCSGT